MFIRVHGAGQLLKQITRLLRGGNSSSLSNKNPENKRRDLIVLSALIDYPGVGLILFETGCAEDLDVVRFFFLFFFFFISDVPCDAHSANTGK